MIRFPDLLSRLKAGKEEKFSFFLFTCLALLQLILLRSALWTICPSIMRKELASGVLVISITFICAMLFNCFFEHPFHRYLLHMRPFVFLKRFAEQHGKHHGLTNIGERSGLIRDRYPITEIHQHEASFFPYYGLSFFFLVFTLILIPVKLLLPGAPVLTCGYLAVFTSYNLYEVWHAIEHLDYERVWKPKVESHRYGWLWMNIYGFHRMHHAVVKCNEGISGFFLIPLADFVFGTYKPTRRLLLDGTLAADEDFSEPRPIWPIRKLDELAKRRELARDKKRHEAYIQKLRSKEKAHV